MASVVLDLFYYLPDGDLRKQELLGTARATRGDINESSTMKTTLKLLMLLLGASFPCIAFAGLVGLSTSAAFFSSEVVLSVFAAAGLLLIGLNDYTYRRIAFRTSPARVCPVVAFGPDQSSRAHGHRREACIAA